MCKRTEEERGIHETTNRRSHHAQGSASTERRSAGNGPPMRWRQREAAERFAERRRRENEAQRLLAVAPRLETLRFEIEERRAGSTVAQSTHVRPIVVANAPALFIFPCQDAACRDGGHDLTPVVCRALRDGMERFEGEDPCRGQTGSADCPRILRFIATATYKP